MRVDPTIHIVCDSSMFRICVNLCFGFRDFKHIYVTRLLNGVDSGTSFMFQRSGTSFADVWEYVKDDLLELVRTPEDTITFKTNLTDVPKREFVLAADMPEIETTFIKLLRLMKMKYS